MKRYLYINHNYPSQTKEIKDRLIPSWEKRQDLIDVGFSEICYDPDLNKGFLKPKKIKINLNGEVCN